MGTRPSQCRFKGAPHMTLLYHHHHHLAIPYNRTTRFLHLHHHWFNQLHRLGNLFYMGRLRLHHILLWHLCRLQIILRSTLIELSREDEVVACFRWSYELGWVWWFVSCSITYWVSYTGYWDKHGDQVLPYPLAVVERCYAQAQMIMLFPLSLSGVAQLWFSSLNPLRRRTWSDLA